MFLALNLVLTKKQKFGECNSTEHINGKNQTNIKNRTYYFYNNQINLEDFDPKFEKLTKKIKTRLTFITLVM